MSDKPPASLLRNHGSGHAPVSYLELFFDLVYVFAITQISHFLHYHPGWLGLAQSAVMFLALWWAWMFTTWASNWADPERVPVRLLMIALMFLSLTMAVAIPDAFGPLGLLFAASYVVLQIGRTFAMALIFRRANPANARNMARITLWFVASAPLWIGGALADPEARIVWWALAIALEYLGPLAYFRVPGMGRSSPSEWDISGAHMVGGPGAIRRTGAGGDDDHNACAAIRRGRAGRAAGGGGVGVGLLPRRLARSAGAAAGLVECAILQRRRFSIRGRNRAPGGPNRGPSPTASCRRSAARHHTLRGN